MVKNLRRDVTRWRPIMIVSTRENHLPMGDRIRLAECRLMAQSGHTETDRYLSAFGGKADMPRGSEMIE